LLLYRQMHLNRVSLTNFRNYARLELTLPDRLLILQGPNAQGKTNLLEAIHLLATGRSPRAVAERELINWLALESSLPYARLEAEIGAGKDAQRLELVLELAGNGGAAGPIVRKQVRINGVPKRGLDLIGRLRVVLFLPEDVNLVAGAPTERRRYLDIMLCQISPVYCRALAEYTRAVSQRNSLLRRLRDQGGDPAQLDFWDRQLAESGSLIHGRRDDALRSLDDLAGARHSALSGGERLHLVYLPGFDPGRPLTEPAGSAPASRQARIADARTSYVAFQRDEVRQRMVERLHRLRRREIAAGSSLCGPHRDDIAFVVDEHDLRLYGSRGQQRTAALALKLAELRFMREETSDTPLLLLDDVMSELDATRRHSLLDALEEVTQALVTTTDWSDFAPEMLRQARTMRVEGGRLNPGTPPGEEAVVGPA
jgi:DNA replication and repair protein RecF